MDNSKQRRRTSFPSSMSRTLWSNESPTKDSRSSDDQKGVNVQVVLRCRPLNEDEIGTKTPQVIYCNELKQEVTATQNSGNKQMDRSFVFDKVFSPESEQRNLYDDVVAPIIHEVLEGYSWTIFAYGQTGTGKTYTMEGEGGKDKNGEFHQNVGVVPRALQQIFDILESQKADYSMKVMFLELYNEEITDLLAPEEGSNHFFDNPKRPLVLMEDGKGAVFVRGIEEEIVRSANEIHKILERGSAKKHTAETLLNKQSNRSHSIFSVMIDIKESNSDGSEVIKCGKLNLVDLAGSENIIRSGAREVRAREAGEINKSLLTLGRVINALAENSPHVPYRESKLTRLLRDSLGGKTKTCMIATISPSILCLEETLSTLDYAFRAKSIKNMPEVNQKVMKSKLVVDLYSQIDHLKQELQATREKNGVYVARDHHQSEEVTKKQLMELQELYLHQQQFMADLKGQLESTQRELTTTRQSLSNLEDDYQRAKDAIKEKENMISDLKYSGKALMDRALELRSDLEDAASDVSTLLARNEHKTYLEDQNRHRTQNIYSQLALQLEGLNEAVSVSRKQQEDSLKVMQDSMQAFSASKAEAFDELSKQIEKLKDFFGSSVKTLDISAEELYRNSQLALHSLSSELSTHSSSIMNLVVKSSSDAIIVSNGLKSNLDYLGTRISAFIKQEEENHVRTYEASKSISQRLLNFSKTLSVYLSKLKLLEEDSQTITNQKLSAFKMKFEEFALDEERLLLEKIAELLASSTSRKKTLIEAAVDDIQESAGKRTNKLNHEIINIQNLNADAEESWTDYVNNIESHFTEDTAAIKAGKSTLEDGLQCCITKSIEIAEQWSIAEKSFSCLLKNIVESVDSFVKDGTEANESIHTRLSSFAKSILEETEDATKNIMLSVESPLRLENETSHKINALTAKSFQAMEELQSFHSQKAVEISETARKSLVDDYMVDDSSCLNPRKREFKLPSKECIENLVNGLSGDSHVQFQPDVVKSKSQEHALSEY